MSTNSHCQTTSGAKRQTISACMIVKNEEKFIAKCLQSIKDVADEIIIVDTGSTDNTIEIAKSFGAKIFHHPWRNDFSEARNHSLRHATGEWVLYIDADETLEQADIPLLRSLINSDSCSAIFVAIYSDLPDGCSKHYYTRLFKREKARFEGIVHEQLICEGIMKQSTIRMYHAGYNLGNDDMSKKYTRTGDLLRKQLEISPDNLFAITNLVRNYRNENNNDKVIELGERGLKIPATRPDISVIHQRQRISLDLANALANTNQLDRAEKVSREALSEQPDFLDNLLQLGFILIAKKSYLEAIPILKKYLIVREKDLNTPGFNLLLVDAYNSEHKAYFGLGECFKKVGSLKDAEMAYKKAIALQNTEPVYYTDLAHLYISQNLPREAENIIRDALKQGIANDTNDFLLGKTLSLQGKPDEAIDVLKQSIINNPAQKNVNIYLLLINLLIQTNRLKEAEYALNSACSLFPNHFGLKCLGEKIRYETGNKESALAFIQNTMNTHPSNSAVSLDLGYFCIDIGEYSLAIDMLEKYLNTTSPDANILANIACCYAKMGKIESAIIGFRTALHLDPACRHASQNLMAMEKLLNKIPSAQKLSHTAS